MPQPTYPIRQIDSPLPARVTLPTMYDLPSENPQESGVPDEYHNLQSQFLSRAFRCRLYPPEQIFTGADLNLYYDLEHTQWYKRPDWFLVVGVSRLYEETDLRASYVVWQEGVNPLVVVELLSPGTAKEDLGENALTEVEAEETITGTEVAGVSAPENSAAQGAKETPPSKWEVYEQILRVPYYIVFNRYTNQMHFFKLVDNHYQKQELDRENPRAWIDELEVGLGLWQGEYEGITRRWLRWYDDQGNWISTDTEQERQLKEQERQLKEQLQSQLHQIVLNLLQQGMSVEQVATLTGLSQEQVEELHQQ